MKGQTKKHSLAESLPNYIIGDDGYKEWLCKHGVGHSKNIHTCDFCCRYGKQIKKKHKERLKPLLSQVKLNDVKS